MLLEFSDGVPDNDLVEVKLAVQKAKLLYGHKGRVEVDAAVLDALVDSATNHVDCTSEEDTAALRQERDDLEEKSQDLENQNGELRAAVLHLLGFAGGGPPGDLRDEMVDLAEKALGEIDDTELNIIEGVEARATSATEAPKNDPESPAPPAGKRSGKAGTSLRAVGRGTRPRRP